MSDLPLGEALDILIDNRGKNPPFVTSGIPAISAKNIKGGRVDLNEARFVAFETYEAWMHQKVKRNDVILTSEAPLGRVARIEDDKPLVIAQRLYGLRGKEGVLDSTFLYYALQTKEVQEQLLSRSSGTTVVGIRQPELLKVRVPVPDFGQQRAVARTLGALDDKIAVNNRIATTALDLGASLFAETLAKDSGSSIVTLGDVAGINLHKASPAGGGVIRYIDISSVSVDKYEWPEVTAWEEAPSRARRKVSAGDVIWSTVRPNRRSRALVLDGDSNIVASTGFAVITPGKVGSAFLYEATRREEFVTYLESVAEGSAYPAVRADRFAKAVIPMLSHSRMAKFEAEAMQLHYRIHAARKENRFLAELRDTLLPKLMSGQVRIRDAEKVVEDAV